MIILNKRLSFLFRLPYPIHWVLGKANIRFVLIKDQNGKILSFLLTNLNQKLVKIGYGMVKYSVRHGDVVFHNIKEIKR